MILGLPLRFWVLCLGQFINRFGSFLMVFLPLYLTGTRGFSTSNAGLIVSVYGAGSLLAGQVGGALSDRFGRRPTMLVGLVAGAVTMLALGLAETPVQITLAAFLCGACNDSYRPALFAAIADVVSPEDRVRAYGYAYWAVNLGFAAAAALSGILANYGYFTLFFADALTTMVFFAIVYFAVPESKPVAAEKQPADPFLPWRDSRFVSFALAQGIVLIIFCQGLTTLALDMRAQGYSPEIYGRTVAWNGVVIVALQPFVLRYTKNVATTHMLALAALFVGAGQGMQGYAGSELAFSIAVAVWTLGEICFSGVTPAFIASIAPQHARGTYQGAMHVLWSIAAIVAPTLGTRALESFGAKSVWLGAAAASVVAAGIHLVRRPSRA